MINFLPAVILSMVVIALVIQVIRVGRKYGWQVVEPLDERMVQKCMTLDPKEYATLYENHAPCPCPESCNADQVCIYRCQLLADTPHNREVLASQSAQSKMDESTH